MNFLIQLTDTHILPPGEVLYGTIDTARHLRETVERVNRMTPPADAVVITGDLVDRGDIAGYMHFIELIKPLKMPVFVLPGNHDNPKLMAKVFATTSCFPIIDDTYQYAIDDLPFKIIALNSHAGDTELPEFNEKRLSWLEDQLGQSDKPALIAIHHPPMKTGIELIDMGGSEWFRGLESLLSRHAQVKLVICGHCHTDLSGRIGTVPVYMAAATSHQLIASRGLSIAPATIIAPAAPVLHHFIEGDFLTGSNAWPADVENNRIDKKSGISWENLKKRMMGARS